MNCCQVKFLILIILFRIMLIKFDINAIHAVNKTITDAESRLISNAVSSFSNSADQVRFLIYMKFMYSLLFPSTNRRRLN